MEHNSSVGGQRPGLQNPDVSEATGDVLVRLCHRGDQPGQTVCHPQPSGYHHGPEKKQGDADGGVDDERRVVNSSGKTRAEDTTLVTDNKANYLLLRKFFRVERDKGL